MSFINKILKKYKNTQQENTVDQVVEQSLKKDESGATAIEYGLIAALICVAVITALTALGTNITATFTNVSNSVSAANKAG